MIQTVNQGYSPNGNDVIKVQEYDLFARAFKQYEPFETNNASGDFVNVVPTGIDFTLTEFEESPLSRPIKSTPPDWYPTHTEYGSNQTTITIPGTSISFDPNELSKVTLIEPDGQ